MNLLCRIGKLQASIYLVPLCLSLSVIFFFFNALSIYLFFFNFYSSIVNIQSYINLRCTVIFIFFTTLFCFTLFQKSPGAHRNEGVSRLRMGTYNIVEGCDKRTTKLFRLHMWSGSQIAI